MDLTGFQKLTDKYLRIYFYLLIENCPLATIQSLCDYA